MVAAPGKHRRREASPSQIRVPPPYGDHPSAPQQRISDPGWSPPYDDYPSWPHPGVLGSRRYPSRGESAAGQREQLPVLHHDHHRYAASSPAAPAPAAGGQKWAAELARTHGAAPHPHQGPASGRNRRQVVLTETPAHDRQAPPGAGVRAQDVLPLRPGQWARAAGPVRIEAAVRLANRILLDADSQAAQIAQQASAHAVATRAAAEQEAACIRQEASAQAAATLAAAERAAAEMRQVAAYVLQNLTAFAEPTTSPAARPASFPAIQPLTEPQVRPTARPAVRPATRPAAQPAARPATRPATKPEGRTRQAVAMRKMMACVVALCLVGGASGATEIALHGLPFFVFRANGAGASITGPKENQGPGQPDAPGAHHPAHQPAHRPVHHPAHRKPAEPENK